MSVSRLKAVPATTGRSHLTETDSQTLCDVADILYYLHNTQSLVGCDYTADDRFINGQYRIIQMLEMRVRSVGQPAPVVSEPRP